MRSCALSVGRTFARTSESWQQVATAAGAREWWRLLAGARSGRLPAYWPRISLGLCGLYWPETGAVAGADALRVGRPKTGSCAGRLFRLLFLADFVQVGFDGL
jgi:hypothetical protein